MTAWNDSPGPEFYEPADVIEEEPMDGPNEQDDPQLDADNAPPVFWTYIREHRQRRGLTVTDLADEAGISRTTIHAAERDPSYLLSGSMLSRIATALGLRVVDLLLPPPDDIPCVTADMMRQDTPFEFD